MSRILVGTNTLTTVDQMAYSNHTQFWFRCGRQTQHSYILANPRRMSIDRMRNMCGRIVCENPDITHLFFLDDDVLIPFDVIDRLISCDADIAAGWTLIRGYPFDNMFFNFDESDGNLKPWRNPVKGDDGLFHVDAVGFSCALIKADLIREMQSPWFITGGYNTEDIYFCMKARKMRDVKIVVDPTVITHHILGPETISPDNREAFITYMQATRPHAVSDKPDEGAKNFPLATTEGSISREELIDSEVHTA
jgi:hypothetical protein